MLYKLLVLIIFVIAYKISNNLYHYLRCKKLKKLYYLWLNDEYNKFPQYKSEVITLFKKADIKDLETPATQPTGYGQIATFNVSVFHNFPSNLKIVAEPSLEMFENAIGVYRKRIFDAFNPLYWIDLLLFLPKNILQYIGLNGEQTAFKVLNVFLTFFWWLICTLISVFNSEIHDIIIKIIN